MTRLYSNNFSTTLNGAITDVATSMTLTSVTDFPAVGSGDTCQVTLDDGTNIEIVQATAIAGSVITIVRGQEGTSGTAFADGDTVEIRATKEAFEDALGADLTPTLAGPLDASGTYIGFGGSSTSTAYCINHAGNIPKLIGAANYYWGFTTSSNIYAQAGTSWNNITFTNDSTRFKLTTNNSERLSINDSGMQLGASGARVTTILDEDTMSSDSATALATQQSIKAYVDSVSGGGTAFKAYPGSNQSISNATFTKVQLDTETFDESGDFDSTTNYRHTPTVAGTYLYTASLWIDVDTDQTDIQMDIRKNGSSIASTAVAMPSATASFFVPVCTIVEMNGSTDYIEFWCWHNQGGAKNLIGDPSYTSLQGVKVS